MEAIYNAILLIPQSPKQATRILCRLANSQPNFIELLKSMAIQLYDRFAPQSQAQCFQYETICKQMLAILNRFINVSFQQKQKDVYLQIENYYQWILQILLCDNISLSCKKLLSTSFKKVLESICYKPCRINEFIEHMMNNSMGSASSIFIYLGCLLDSSLDKASKFDSVVESYTFLYHTAMSQYKDLINFYHNQHMEFDEGIVTPYSIFLRRLKQSDFMLSQLYNMFKLISQIFKTSKHYKDLDKHSYQIFFHPQLANFISCVLKMQEDLLNTKQKENVYGLKFIIITSLKNDEKDIINQQKSLCLSILTIIYSLTDKGFNILYTDKLLMKELFNLTDLIVNQLLICSQKDVFHNISIELEITDIIASMFDLLSVIVLFKDIQPSFQSLNIEKIIRLTFFYTKTFQEQLSIYQSSPDQYFHFNYYMCEDSLSQRQIGNEIDEFKHFSIKRKAVSFIKQMSNKIEGFHSIIMDICCDYIKLWVQQKLQFKQNSRQLFLQKYSLMGHEIFQCIQMQSVLFIFTILLQHSWQQHEKLKRMYLLLSTVRLSFFNNLQLYRLYVCLSVNHKMFILHKGHTNYYNFVQKVYKLDNKPCSTTQAGYYFIQKLILHYSDNSKDYQIFIQKLLHEVIEEFQTAQSFFPFQTISNALKAPHIQLYIGLQWISKSLMLLNKRISKIIQSYDDKCQILTLILKLYYQLMKFATKKIKQNQQLPYPRFQLQKNQYQQHISQLASINIFKYLDKLLRSQENTEEKEAIIANFSKIFLCALIEQIPIQQNKVELILNFTLSLLLSQNENQQQIKQTSFQLLYQLISIRLFTFDERIHNIILKWMKQIYYQSQVGLSQVCIILQQLYYYIDGNPNQNQYHFLMFYSSIIQILEKKFFQHLFQYHNYYQALQEELDINVRKINELRIQFDPKITIKTNPVTIIRLYNTILLNPYFDITIIRKIHEMIKKYNFQIIPTYDLALQVLALQSLIKRNSNISVIQCFRFTTELLGYNCKDHNSKGKGKSDLQIKLAHLTTTLKSTITAIDPYETYAILIQRYIFRPQLVNRSFVSNRIDQIQISIIDFLQNDKYLLNLVKKLVLIRNVNSKTRLIRKIKKENNDQFI